MVYKSHFMAYLTILKGKSPKMFVNFTVKDTDDAQRKGDYLLKHEMHFYFSS